MSIELRVDTDGMSYDDIDVIKKAIDDHEYFELAAFLGEIEDEARDVFLYLDNKNCSITWCLSYPEAYFFCKSLLALMEAGNKKWINKEGE